VSASLLVAISAGIGSGLGDQGLGVPLFRRQNHSCEILVIMSTAAPGPRGSARDTGANPTRESRPDFSVADVVRRYYRLVCDLESHEDDLRAVLAPDVRIVEHPNAVTPRGAVRDREQTLAGLRSGRALLSRQDFDVHEVLVHGDRAAVRATWRGTIAVDRGPFTAGTVLRANIASLLTVRDGLIVEQETYDCYEPFPTV
jgi:ketosteroid isomerase-like protein